MPSHGHRVYIETDGEGSPRFTRPKSPHHQHHRHHRRYSDEFVFRDDLDIMQDRERELRNSYDQVYRQNQSLKLDLQNRSRDLEQHKVWVQQLQRENKSLRESLDGNSDVESRYESKIRELRKSKAAVESENSELKHRIRKLTNRLKDAFDNRIRPMKDQISVLTKEVADWRRRHDDVERRMDRMRANLNQYVADNEALKEEVALLRQANTILERMKRRTMF
ncbi:hypothetical protein B0T22DRAFT_383686 [Podospora appendiculata]|uniref:Uncharacterized protein n=1 Tax=Podospora appendiculata TaxID=314037 RepID=A0AAE0X365_9PEZI|nr:hypothetical protein B0T22DRAFT_383686 [Podospora appendiculata]